MPARRAAWRLACGPSSSTRASVAAPCRRRRRDPRRRPSSRTSRSARDASPRGPRRSRPRCVAASATSRASPRAPRGAPGALVRPPTRWLSSAEALMLPVARDTTCEPRRRTATERHVVSARRAYSRGSGRAPVTCTPTGRQTRRRSEPSPNRRAGRFARALRTRRRARVERRAGTYTTWDRRTVVRDDRDDTGSLSTNIGYVSSHGSPAGSTFRFPVHPRLPPRGGGVDDPSRRRRNPRSRDTPARGNAASCRSSSVRGGTPIPNAAL